MVRNFTIEFKLMVIKYAEDNSGNAASRKFNLDPKRVREWKKQKSDLEFLLSNENGNRMRATKQTMRKISENILNENNRKTKENYTIHDVHQLPELFKICDLYNDGGAHCANCTTSLSMEKITSIKRHDPFIADEDVTLTDALSLIFEIHWKDIFEQIQNEYINFSYQNSEIMMCKNCATLFEDIYSAYCQFTLFTHPDSLMKLAKTHTYLNKGSKIRKERNIKPNENSTDEDSAQDEDDSDLLDGFNFEEDIEIPDEDSLLDVKYDTSIINDAEEDLVDVNSKDEANNSELKEKIIVNTDKLPAPREKLPRSSKRKHQKSTERKEDNHEVTKYECDSCGKKFDLEKKLQTHLKMHQDTFEKVNKSKDGELSCIECGKAFKTMKYVKRHIKLMHSNSTVNCAICEKVMKNKAQFQYHMKLTHTSQQEIEKLHTCCEICGKKMHTTSIERHLSLVHSTEKKSFNCDQCDKVFPSEEKLKLHVEAHYSNAVYKCTQCAKKFPTEHYLNEHVENYHKVEKPFGCDKCPLKFKAKYELVRHAPVHSDVKQFVCEECGKGYSTRNSLKLHLKCHRDEELGPEAFKCPDCDKFFKNGFCLKTHKIRAHRSDLVAGKRLFMCSVCGKRLYDERNLKKHVAAVHGDA